MNLVEKIQYNLAAVLQVKLEIVNRLTYLFQKVPYILKVCSKVILNLVYVRNTLLKNINHDYVYTKSSANISSLLVHSCLSTDLMENISFSNIFPNENLLICDISNGLLGRKVFDKKQRKSNQISSSSSDIEV